MKINISKQSCLYQSSLGEFLVDLWLVHDTLGPVSIVQSAQSFLQLHYKSIFLIMKKATKEQYIAKQPMSYLQIDGSRRHSGDN